MYIFVKDYEPLLPAANLDDEYFGEDPGLTDEQRLRDLEEDMRMPGDYDDATRVQGRYFIYLFSWRRTKLAQRFAVLLKICPQNGRQ